MSALFQNRLVWGAALAAAFALTGCKDDAYCFVCEHSAGNGGGGTTNGGGGSPDIRTGDGGPMGTGETFNIGGATCGIPNNIANCGECGKRCERFGATAECDTSGSDAVCKYECSLGFVDLDGDLGKEKSNGCEYECLPTNGGVEICDGYDNDCDGDKDEGVSTNDDVNNCGACRQACAPDRAQGKCEAGVCKIKACQSGWFDVDNDPTNGCEYYCQSNGPEVCDGIDNDCDQLIDDADPDVQVDSDVRHCGSCDNNCEGKVPNASPACVAGECVVGNCLTGFFDKEPDQAGCETSCSNQNCSFPFAFANCDDKGACSMGDCLPGYYDLDPAVPGCEYYCIPSGDEICDGKDNDCNGKIDAADPGVKTTDDPLNCGACGNSCAGKFANSAPICKDGQCVLTCLSGYVDADKDGKSCEFSCDACFFPNGTADEPACLSTGKCVFKGCLPGYIDTDPAVPGCEYQCTPTNPPTEVCDGKDNDCNGKVDDGVLLDPQNCGACGLDCSLFFPGATTSCTLVNNKATCGFVACKPGYGNVDGVPENGCEYLCTKTNPATETCDGKDNDCNGIVDDVAPANLPNACTGANNLAVGECTATTKCTQVSAGVFAPTCVLLKGPSTEVCDGKDNDCDGSTDENTAQDPLPGVGIACGTSRGECTFGARACVNGSLVCQGGQGAVTETCDNKDNDCNGLVDDLPSTSCGSNVGACKLGTSQCVSGTSVCAGATAAVAEVCDGNGSTAASFDNDCDGTTDEGCVQLSGAPIRHDAGGIGGSKASTQTQHSSFQLTSATAGDEYVVAYADSRDGNASIYGFASINGGTSWTAATNPGDVKLSGSTDPRVEPNLFMRAGRAYVVYSAFNAFSGGDSVRRIMIASSASPYTTWSTEKRADDSADDTNTKKGRDFYTPMGTVVKADAGGNNDYIAVIWNQIGGTATSPERDVYFRYSKNGGTSWSTSVSVNASDHAAELPVVASDGAGVAYVAWRSGGSRVAFRRIDLTATTPAFDATIFLQPNVTNIGSSDLRIAADTTNVHVTWTDLRTAKKTVRVASARSCALGNTAAQCSGSFTQVGGVTDGIVVSTGAVTDDASKPTIAARGGNVVVAWQDTRSGASDIRVNRATYTGGAWNWLAEPSRADAGDPAGSTASTVPHIAYGNGTNVLVTWQDLRNPAIAIYANVSIDGGATFYNGAGANSLRMDGFTPAAAAAADSLTPFVLATPNANRAAVVFLDFHSAANANTLNGDVYTQLLQ